MKQFLPILILVCSAWPQAGEPARPASPQATPQASAQAGGSAPVTSAPAKSPTISADQENARKARALIDQAIQALGGQAYLTIRDREMQGRSYSFHHGRPSNGGVIFWGFSEYPDKERIELTKERDVTELYVGDKGYELTYKGVHPSENKISKTTCAAAASRSTTCFATG